MAKASPNTDEAISRDATEAGQPPSGYRWVMLALLWLHYFSFGAMNRTIAPLVTPIITDLKMSYGQMGLVMGSWQLSYMGAAFVAGYLIDRWGIRKSLFWGAVIISLSVGLRYFASSVFTLLPMVALFGIGGPMLSTGCPKAISLWFRGKERGTAVGIYTTGPWLGGALVLAATNRLVMPLTGHSWRLAFVFYGSIALAVALLWWFLAVDARSTETAEKIGIRAVFVKLIRVRNVQAAVAIGLITFAILHIFTGWLPKILESMQFSPTFAGYASSVPLLAGIPAMLFFPRIVPPQKRGAAVAVTALAILLATWMIFRPSGMLLPLGLVLYGMATGTLFPVITLTLMDTPEVGTKYIGSAVGLFFCISEIGGFIGPFAVGMLVDWTGGFTAAGYFVAVLTLAIISLSFLIKK